MAEASSGLEPYLENLQEEKRQIGSLIDACIENASISKQTVLRQIILRQIILR